MKQPHFYIRHTIGSRLLLDSITHGITYDVHPHMGKWKFVIALHGASDRVEDILRFKGELNLFIAETMEDGKLQKWWYYDSREPEIEFDKENNTVTMIVDSRKGYIA